MGRYLIFTLLLIGFLSGCTFHKKEENVNGSLRVQIPFVVDGKYSLQVIELVTLENLVSLKGLAAQFLIDPDTVSGKLRGRNPELKYIRDSEDVIVAKDILSLQLLTVYAHFEKMRAMDQQLGVTNKVVWPATIAINARYKTEAGTMTNNALYSGQHDALLMVPYTGNDLPIMVNAGVLAHEHFHNIFQKMIVEPLGQKFPGSNQPTSHDQKEMIKSFGISDEDVEEVDPAEKNLRQIYHEVLLRGLNEGLADVWGWIYSGDDAFVGRSLPSEKLRRQLNVQFNGSVEPMERIKGMIDSGLTAESRLGYSYALGIQYARILRNYASVMNSSRQEMGLYILRILPELLKKYDSLSATEYLRPVDVIDIFINQGHARSAQECFYFAQFVPKSEGGADTETRCQALQGTPFVRTPGEKVP